MSYDHVSRGSLALLRAKAVHELVYRWFAAEVVPALAINRTHLFMRLHIHPQVFTTPNIRQEIKDCDLSELEAANILNSTHATSGRSSSLNALMSRRELKASVTKGQ